MKYEKFNLDSTRTDSRRAIVRAFDKLRDHYGFQARMRFSCCRVCAAIAIERKIAMAERPEDFPTRVVFFTQRDDREAAATGRLNLNYGDIRLQNATRPLDRAAGKLLMQALREAGLEPEWDENPDRRIIVPVHPWMK
jgi:hypothetical protein